MKINWLAVLFAFIITCIMLISALIQQINSYGEETLEMVVSPIGVLAWGSSFTIALIFWYIILDFLVRRSKKKELTL